MRQVKLNEYGRDMYFNAATDISQAIGYTVRFTKPNGTTADVVAELGTTDITGENLYGESVVYLAGEYAKYTTEEGLIDAAGRWTYQLYAPTPTASIPSACGSFQVSC